MGISFGFFFKFSIHTDYCYYKMDGWMIEKKHLKTEERANIHLIFHNPIFHTHTQSIFQRDSDHNQMMMTMK